MRKKLLIKQICCNLLLFVTLFLFTFNIAFGAEDGILDNTPETDTPKIYKIGIVFLDNFGELKPEIFNKWDPEWNKIINVSKDYTISLYPTFAIKDINDFFSVSNTPLFVNLLCHSTYRKTYFNVDFVVCVLVYSDTRGKFVLDPVVINVDNTSESHLPHIANTSVANGVKILNEELKGFLSERCAPNRVFLVNPYTGIYHLEDAGHLSPSIVYKVEKDFDSLSIQGYKPCQICFPQYSRIFSQDSTEYLLSKEVTSAVEYEYRTSDDSVLTERVKRVGDAIIKANDFQTKNYVFRVLETDEINAYSIPGGPIYITRALLELSETDDELACIIGHEIAHSEFHHMLKQFYKMQNLQWIGALITIATQSQYAALLSDFLSLLFTRGYDRIYENESDYSGVVYAANAGYNTEEMLITFKKFKDIEKIMPNNTISWFRTHPKTDIRIENCMNCNEKLKKIKAVFEGIRDTDTELYGYINRNLGIYINCEEKVSAFFMSYQNYLNKQVEGVTQ